MGTHLSYPMKTNTTGLRRFFSNRCVIMLWIKVALALELIRTDLFEAMTLHFTNKPYGPQNDLDYVKEHIVDIN